MKKLFLTAVLFLGLFMVQTPVDAHPDYPTSFEVVTSDIAPVMVAAIPVAKINYVVHSYAFIPIHYEVVSLDVDRSITQNKFQYLFGLADKAFTRDYTNPYKDVGKPNVVNRFTQIFNQANILFNKSYLFTISPTGLIHVNPGWRIENMQPYTLTNYHVTV